MEVILVAPHGKLSAPLIFPTDKEKVTNIGMEMIKTLLFLQKWGSFKEIYALAHSQVNRDNPRRLFVLNPNMDLGWAESFVICNPTFKPMGTLKKKKEQCVTFQNAPPAPVMRYEKGTLYWQSPDGVDKVTHLTGRLAQVAQHEIDHMNGKYLYAYTGI